MSEQSVFEKAVADVSEVMKFENWVRFYFVDGEEGEAVRIKIPQEVIEEVKGAHNHLWEIADRYDGLLVDYQRSCTEVCAHVGMLYDGSKYPPGVVSKVFDSKDLKIEMYLFGLWMQGHEAQLDTERMAFSDWVTGYESWKGSDEVKDYLSRLTDVEGQSQGGSCCTTKQ